MNVLEEVEDLEHICVNLLHIFDYEIEFDVIEAYKVSVEKTRALIKNIIIAILVKLEVELQVLAVLLLDLFLNHETNVAEAK